MGVVTIHCNHCGAPLTVSGDTRYVTCAHCGSSLEVKHGDGSIYTEMLREIGERTAVIDAQATEMQDRLADVSVRAEIIALDQAWERDREQYMVTDEHGLQRKPSVPAGVIGLALAVVGGLIMLAMVFNVTSEMTDKGALTGPSFRPDTITLPDGTTVGSGETVRLEDGSIVTYDGGSALESFGSIPRMAAILVLLMMGVAAAILLNQLRQADRYERAEQEYRARRQELLSRLNDD